MRAEICFVGVAAWVCLAAASSAAAAPAALPSDAQAFLGRTCLACHSGAKPQAGLDLTQAVLHLDDRQNFDQWVRIYDRVEKGEMPPAGRVDSSQKAAFLRSVGDSIAGYEQRRNEAQGRSVLRRLNRYEYENTLRDLLAAPWLALRDSLPEDGIVNRFNKSGRALDVSHVQMARYMEAADQAMRQVLDQWGRTPETHRYYARDQKRFINRMRYSPFNRHPERASIPILGFDAQPEVLAETAPISVGESDPARRELEGFAFTNGTYTGNEYHFDQFTAPVGGRYKLRFHAFSLWVGTKFGLEARREGKPYWHPDREKTSRGRTVEPITIYALSQGGEKRLLGSFDAGPDPAVHEMEVYLRPGEQIRPDAARLFRSRPGFIGSPDATKDGIPGVAYRWMEVTGPVSTSEAQQGYRRLFGDLPASRLKRGPIRVQGGSLAQAEPLLRQFMATAYRRPSAEKEVERYLGIVRERLAGPKPDFFEAMLAGYTAILCSPGFLYLEEQAGPLDGYALASRLSYFLWNAPPDRELRDLASSGRLNQPQVLRAQTERLLASPRSSDSLNAFLDYWLDLRKLGDTTPDQVLYPDYYLDDLLVESALQETRLFVAKMLRDDLPASNLIDSRFTYLNSHLARHYGLPPVDGVAMRLVELPKDSVRGGLLTQASVLKITANGTTTSPVLRGAWIQERILGQPPPPPPASVQAVDPDTRGATTIREQLAKHRSVQSCAVCHAKIDPPGFALESFDVLGGWRERYRSTQEGEPVPGIGKNGQEFAFRLGQPADPTGELADGRKFADVRELKRLLIADERQIARNLLSQLLLYATGSPVSFADRPAVERMLDATAMRHYGMRTLIHQVVQSDLFTHK